MSRGTSRCFWTEGVVTLSWPDLRCDPHGGSGSLVNAEPDRWDGVFADLEAQAQTIADENLADEIADRTRREWAQISLIDRLTAARHRVVSLRILDSSNGFRIVSLLINDVGPEWLVGSETESGAEWLLPLRSIISVTDLGQSSESTDTKSFVGQRYGISAVVRRWVRDRRTVTLGVAGLGDVTGTLNRAGRDHVDVAVHPADIFRRTTGVAEIHTISYDAIRWIKRR